MAKQKPAYLVASSFMEKGHGSLDAYAEATHPLLEKYGGELLIAGGPDQFMDHYEGEWKEGACFTLFKFLSMEALQSFWNSKEYQAAKHLRTGVTPPNFTFGVEGFDMEDWLDEHPEQAKSN